MPAVQFNGPHCILHRRTVDAPSAQPADLQHGLLERKDQLPGGGNVELLQHLQAEAARAIQPETGDQFDCDLALISRSGVERVRGCNIQSAIRWGRTRVAMGARRESGSQAAWRPSQ
jgi:hypothetical protein